MYFSDMNFANQEIEKRITSKLLSELRSRSDPKARVEIQPWSLSSWEIEEMEDKTIATGGYGEIYRGIWLGTTKVAIKKIRISQLDTNKAREIFNREVKIWYPLRHPNVISLFGACDTAERPFLVMPFMTNGTALKYVDSYPEARFRLIYETACGLGYLHSRQIVHGDLKALNILVDDSGTAKIIDFGLAMVKTMSTTQSKFTGYGTRRWTAPELLRNRRAKRSSEADIYAFGITCFEIVSLGETPLSDFNEEDVAGAVMDGERPEPQPDDCPDRLWSYITQYWDDDPSKRPSFTVIAKQLEVSSTHTIFLQSLLYPS
ncbi:kinase-like domain-containing protein [Paraphysoderma sedebokerense]|nr:kinase-like domain-containing protein [Paraphysoderma sedebokerense]